jgi:uncharacterized glyoxalase superfamily protein PhnB
MSVKAQPDGYHAITPFVMVKGASQLIDFLKAAFGGMELSKVLTPDGGVMHAEVKLGDSIVMIGDPMDGAPFPSNLYFYTADVDATYRAALSAGAESMRAPVDEFWGDRVAGVKDPTGNLWWIATHVEDVTPDEIERRAKSYTPECGA